MTDMHRRLGDAVHVDQHGGTVDVMLIPIFKSPHVQRFTTKDHMPQNKRSSELRMLPLRLHQLIECRRCLVENGDAFARKQRQKLFGRAPDRVGNDDQSTAMKKWTPNLPHGEIEGERMEQGPNVMRVEVEQVFGGAEQAHDVLMRNGDAFWRSGGA